MNLFNHVPLTVYLVVVLGVAAISSAAALTVVADAVARRRFAGTSRLRTTVRRSLS
jgi:peptidoglycan hydrolase-like amidase